MSSVNIPSTRDVLMDHLYSVVEGLVPESAAKVTGMIGADCDDKDLLQLLGDRVALQHRVTIAMDCLVRSSHDRRDQALGEDLYSQVSALEPAHSNQITGMLLELSEDSVRHLLSDPEALQTAVHRALEEIRRVKTAVPGDQSLSEAVAEQLYAVVCQVYPKNAPKITGMLAELGESPLSDLLNSDRTRLLEAVEKCRVALNCADLWIQEN